MSEMMMVNGKAVGWGEGWKLRGTGRGVVLTQIHDRAGVARWCLEGWREWLPEGWTVAVWDDRRREEREGGGWEWLTDWGHRMPRGRLMGGCEEGGCVGIDEVRARQLAWALGMGFDWVYLTDTDAVHDPGWWDAARRLLGVAADRGVEAMPVCLYNSKHHAMGRPVGGALEGESYELRNSGPGISLLLHRFQVEKVVKRLRGRTWSGWDWRLVEWLGGRVVTAVMSHVEHLGAGGLHSGKADWDRDRAVNPTWHLQRDRERFLMEGRRTRKGLAAGPRTVLERLREMEPKVVIVNQPLGVGDVLFLKAAVDAVRAAVPGAVVWWVVDRALLGMQKHVRVGEGLQFVPREAVDYEWVDAQRDLAWRGDGVVAVLPMRWCDQILGVPYRECMRAKYDWLGLDWRMWVKGRWQLDQGRMRALVKELGLDLPGQVGEVKRYAVTCRHFRSDRSGRLGEGLMPGLEGEWEAVVEYAPVEGYTVLDWWEVLRRAAAIHAVGTSLQYVVELAREREGPVAAENGTGRLRMWPRWPDEVDCENYRGLFQAPWVVETVRGNH